MGDGGIFAILDGTGPDLSWQFHGWLFVDGRPTKLGPLLWRVLHLKPVELVAAEGPGTPGHPLRALTVTHEDPDPRGNGWLYLLNPRLRRLALLVAVRAPAPTNARLLELLAVRDGEPPLKAGPTWHYSPTEGYAYELLHSYDLREAKAPMWEEAERVGLEKRGASPSSRGDRLPKEIPAE